MVIIGQSGDMDLLKLNWNDIRRTGEKRLSEIFNETAMSQNS